MPGSNCAIVNCGTHRGTNKCLSFFKIRQPRHPEWEQALVKAVNRCDASFNKDRATICSRHFTPDCIKESKGGQRSLIPGSLPTLWMPSKSVETRKVPPRKPPKEREAPSVPKVVAYYSFKEVQTSARDVQLPWLLLKVSDEEISIGVLEGHAVKLLVKVLPDFSVQVFVYGFRTLAMDSSVECISLSTFLKKVQELNICPGITDPSLQKFAQLPSGQKTQQYFKHISYIQSAETVDCTSTVRSFRCAWLQSSREPCAVCAYTKTLLLKKQERANLRSSRSVNKKTPLSACSPDTLKKALKNERMHSKKIRQELDKFTRTLTDDNRNVTIMNSELHTSLKSIMDSAHKLQPLQMLFWQEQLKAFRCSSPHGMRWHPSIIRLAILLHSRSPAAYDTLRKTGVLRLPGESTLQDYTNVSSPQEGFSVDALNAIKGTCKNLKEHERFVVLMHDEMTIKSDLVFDNRTGEMVGFVNLESESRRQLATHVLVFYVVGVNSTLKASLGYFGTCCATAEKLFPLFWKAVFHLEVACKLKVIASVSDKATPNQRLYDMHDSGSSICYKARNLFSTDREIFFISDPPHLVKTVRNNISHSGSGKNTRMLWVNGLHILWRHVLDVYYTDCRQQMHRTKLTAEHVFLTPASLMNVRLAAQVLSQRVGKVMLQQGGPDCQETAKFILLMDRFFDCMNSRAIAEGMMKRKPDLQPYFDHHDDRFKFFEDFLQYLLSWKESVQQRAGFSLTEKNKMFLSYQTFKGLYITLKSFPEAARYLLSNGVQFVLSNRFCQDPLEKHFGRHRGLGRRCDNPSLWAFGYSENKLRLQRDLTLAIQPRGNVSQKRQADETFVVSTSPIKKKKRH